MKRAAFLNLVIVGAVLSLAVTGCRRGPKALTPIPGSQAGTGQSGPPPIIDNGAALGGSGVTGEGIAAAPRPGPDATYNYDVFSAETVYFDFDSSVVKPSEVGKLDTVVQFLMSDPSTAILIDGHCDERGTEEYNRALGERRALSIRESMVGMGGDPDRIHTRSLGEDDPADPGHNESAWDKNRRGVFAVIE